jgi:hypothetical protein
MRGHLVECRLHYDAGRTPMQTKKPPATEAIGDHLKGLSTQECPGGIVAGCGERCKQNPWQRELPGNC